MIVSEINVLFCIDDTCVFGVGKTRVRLMLSEYAKAQVNVGSILAGGCPPHPPAGSMLEVLCFSINRNEACMEEFAGSGLRL